MTKKIKIQIKHYFTGSVLFEYESDDNTLRETVIKAVDERANLRGANLRGANLSSANLSSANLSSANLRGANLSSANLSSANLSSANLSSANLSSADLSSADLSSADLSGANLRGADLRGANLRGANLRGANLSSAKNAELAIAQTRILPEGSIYGYKKCQGGVIVKLRIPAKAKRSHAFGRKCRAEFAKVVAIYGADEARSIHDSDFVYRKGETVYPSNGFDENWQDECSSGIHFYINRVEAENHV
ncbi:pentapeptide repeat-containing protein [Rhodococcus erythropolis]|uniref:pentapeptide repeat-containing protein n=1 Tax=Rhodococcus erythropolis TaxID=1833 RepID=UPI0030137211